MRPWTQIELLSELEPVVGRELDRHLSAATDWFPHEYVPWSEGSNFDGVLGGEAWDPAQSKLSRGRPHRARRQPADRGQPAELPPRDRYESFGRDGAWGTWVHRWTAEEGRHGIAIRDYLLDHPRGRPGRARAGPDDAHGRPGFASHVRPRHAALGRLRRRSRNSPPASRTATPAASRSDPVCDQLLARIAPTRTCTWSSTATCWLRRFELAPDQTMRAITDVVTDLPDARQQDRGFTRKLGTDRHGRHLRPAHPPRRRARADPAVVGRLGPRRAVRVGEQAREQLGSYFDELDQQASRFEERRAARQARTAARS